MKNKLIEYAKSQIGYLEKKSNKSLIEKTANAGRSNYTIYAEDYKDFWGNNYQAQPWCAVFVSVIFMKVFGRDDICPPFAYCPTGVNQFKKMGEWYTTMPEVGDVIFFTNGSRAYHTGIVISVDSKRVYTVEGNTSAGADVIENGGAVAAKSYLLSNKKILGYGRPRYELMKGNDKMTADERKEFEDLKARVKALEEPEMVYGYIDENMPSWAHEAVRHFADKGILKGNGEHLNLNDTKLWILTILYRIIKGMGWI